jgi:hypothetical protein
MWLLVTASVALEDVPFAVCPSCPYSVTLYAARLLAAAAASVAKELLLECYTRSSLFHRK